ncbi:MAG TPA: site-2 protease family protein [Terriglobales bacterium]|nr:site-2 protease family protein [Terriglobales bacterium]
MNLTSGAICAAEGRLNAAVSRLKPEEKVFLDTVGGCGWDVTGIVMRAQIKLGRIAGIAIGLHYSWFIIALLITLSLTGHFHAVMPQWSDAVVWSISVITSVLFFVSLLAHELAHSLLAKAKGLKVRAITLFALGGVSQIETEAPDAKTEFWVAIVGPLSSFAIGLVCLLLAYVTGWTTGAEARTPLTAVLLWLGYINVILGAFNLVPGYPLDGGRVLRAVIWFFNQNAVRATQLAARVGQGVAFLFILLGLFQFFVGKNFGGLWLAFIGWFLLDASRSSYTQVELTEALRGQRVADMMDHDCPTIESHLSLQDFVHEYLLRSGRRCYVVVQDDRLVGLITPADVKHVDPESWPQTSVQSVMRRAADLRMVAPDTPVMQALEIMTREDINQLPVVSQGRLQGIFSRSSLMGFLRNRTELLKR